MPREFEVVPHTRMKHITAFLVRLEQRVTHIHRELEIGYVLEGSLSLRTQAQTIPLCQGDAYLVNRMEPHEFVSLGSGALLIAIQLSPRLMDGFLSSGAHYHYEGSSNLRMDLQSEPERYRQICACCVELAYSFLRMEPNYEFRCFTLCAALVQILHDSLLWTQMDSENYTALKQRANRILEITNYIDQNFQRKLLLTEIAQQSNLSMTYLSHFFKDTMGMSFQEYLNRKRFEYACELLFSTNRKILDISISSGFSDVRYFNDAFSQFYGCSPKEYRKGKVLQAVQLHEQHQNSQSFFTEQAALEFLRPFHNQAQSCLQSCTLANLAGAASGKG